MKLQTLIRRLQTIEDKNQAKGRGSVRLAGDVRFHALRLLDGLRPRCADWFRELVARCDMDGLGASMRSLRLLADVSKEEFDLAALQAAGRGCVVLVRCEGAESLSAFERDELIADGWGGFYGGAKLRPPAGVVANDAGSGPSLADRAN